MAASLSAAALAEAKEVYTNKDMEISVESPPEGFFCRLKMKSKVPLSPEEVFDILADTEDVSFFRSIKKIKSRKILKDDGVSRTAEVEQVARWQLGFLRGHFSMKLHIHQQRDDKTIHFKLAHPGGFMRDFTGSWKISPYSTDSHVAVGPLEAIKAALIPQDEYSYSMVELEQSVAPRRMPPPPLDNIIRRISASQIKEIMEDLQREALRRRVNAKTL